MGEIRPNHFHGGLDIKTEGRIGLPVYAAARASWRGPKHRPMGTAT